MSTTEALPHEFKAWAKQATHADYPGNLWDDTSLREKSMMLKAWRAAPGAQPAPSEPGAESKLRMIFNAWNEFGPEHGFGELMDRLHGVRTFTDPPVVEYTPNPPLQWEDGDGPAQPERMPYVSALDPALNPGAFQTQFPAGFKNRGDSTFEGGSGLVWGEVPAEPSTFEDVEQKIVARYRVESKHSGYWGYCVKAGDGDRELFSGHRKQCDLVAAALQTACLDGAFMAREAIAPTGTTENRIDRLETELAQARAAVPDIGAIGSVEWWLRSALQCPNFAWDRDQHECAELTLKARLAALKRPVLVPGDVPTEVANRRWGESYGVDWVYEGCDTVARNAKPVTASSADARDVAPTAAARDVLAERARQISAEGWTVEHDDEHQYGELSRAAGSYALFAASTLSSHPGVATSLHRSAAGAWPWNNPSKANACTERRNLVKAGALVLAEIERLDRAAIATTQPPQKKPCIGNDKHCPCNDGDVCNYAATKTTAAFPVKEP